MTTNASRTVKLHNMQIDEFDKFSKWSINDYAEELLLAKQSSSKEKALQKAENEFNEILPYGLETKDNYLMMIVNESDEDVGVIWYLINGNMVFICDFVIFEKYRRCKYGYMTLEQLEIIAIKDDKESIMLHVFSYNTPAIGLYKKFGFIIVQEKDNGSIYMQKKLI
ncbi:MAG TPA: GNAT family N-acetyltransferase [Clostridia bacterium]|nr:MAG: putative N-acetyltransferase YycN [Firmicutes bacterium ADurb.Bin146]HOD92756.1 GNAT family N-acetyltransferase [Clostridia bacterium]HQM40093.1 GNAT family N-acetyltransferase [Clostridia bacterium]